MGITTTERKE
jgi:hypothetical protein